MRGTIIHYNAQDGRGLIAARDGRQYAFAITQWRSGVGPKVDQVVELEAGQSLATAIVLVPRHILLKEKVHRLLARLGLSGPSDAPHAASPEDPPQT